MDIKDSYLHGTVGVVKSISVDADKLKYKLADTGGGDGSGTVKEVTMPTATQSANGLLSSADKKKLDSITGKIKDSDIIWGETSISGDVSPIDNAASYLHSGNKLLFARPEGITIEYSTNGGSTWIDYGITNAYKIGLVSGLYYTEYIIGKGLSTKALATDLLRITLHATNMGVYTRAKSLLVDLSTNGSSNCKVKVETATKGSQSSFSTIGEYPVAGWSGWNRIPLNNMTFGGDASLTSHIEIIRLTFTTTGTTKETGGHLRVLSLLLLGVTSWSTPSNMARTGHLYNWNSTLDAVFPALITATLFNGPLKGTADKVANNLILKINSGATEGTSLYTYNGSSAKTLDIKNGTGIGFTNTAGVLSIYNSGVRSISTGTTNGTISVNTNGTSTDIAVKGLASAAYVSKNTFIQQISLGTITGPADLYNRTKDYFGNYKTILALLKSEEGSWGHLLLKFLNATKTEWGVDGSGLFMTGSTFYKWCFTGKDTEESPLAVKKYKIYDESNCNNSSTSWTASTFIGNLDGTYVNKLTGYTKATSASDLAATDSLNTALGKLEYKAGTAYDWYKSITEDDTDTIINKWSEIVDFIDSVAEGTDITDEFVTRKTTQTITGSKTFTAATNTFSGTGASMLTVDRTSTNPTWIRFVNNGTVVGYLGVTSNKVALFYDGTSLKTLLHSENYKSYTPLLNSSSDHATNTSVIYAPTSAGAAGQVLVSNGSGAPTWANSTNLTVKLAHGYGNNSGSTSDRWFQVAQYTRPKESYSSQINTNVLFYVTDYYLRHNSGLLRVRGRFNSSSSTPTWLRAEWIVNNGFDLDTVKVAYVTNSDNTTIIKLYAQTPNESWTSIKFVKISDGGWGDEGSYWVMTSVRLSDIPTNETAYSSINASINNSLTNALTFSPGAFTSSLGYNGSNAVTVNIPTHTSHLTNDSNYVTGGPYLPLTGGTVSNSSNSPLSIKIKDSTGWAGIGYGNTSGIHGYIGVDNNNHPIFVPSNLSTYYKIWHKGNDGADSELDADLLDGCHATDLTPTNAYDYSAGCLVKTSITTDSNAMITFRIEGNSYEQLNPILTVGSFYNYNVNDRILASCATHYGYDFGKITVFCYGGYVYLWFKLQASYLSFTVTVYQTNGTGINTNKVVSITRGTVPTSGVSRQKEITPNIGITSSNYTSYLNSTNFPGLAGVRSVTLNGNYLKVNTDGIDANLTIPYATKAHTLNYKKLPSTVTNVENTVWCKFATLTFNTTTWDNVSGYLFFSGEEIARCTGILHYLFRSGNSATSIAIAELRWLVNDSDIIKVIASKVQDNVYDLYVNNIGTYETPIIYHMSAVEGKFAWSVGGWTTTKPTVSYTSTSKGRVNYAYTANNSNTVGGIAPSGLLTAVSSSAMTNFTITVGGTTKSVSALYAKFISGEYTSNGGELRPSYVASGTVRWNMMRNTTTYFDQALLSGYCDWMMMDTYIGPDVPYVTMIGVSKTATPHAYIASGAKGSTDGKWTIKALLDSANYTDYTVKKDGTGASGTWNISVGGSASSLSLAAYLRSNEEIDGFIEAAKFKFGHFKTDEQNSVGMAYNDGMILSLPWTSTNYGVQMAFDDTKNATIKVRGKADTWGDWKQLAFTSDIPTSLKNPNSIRFKDRNGNLVSYNGESAVDLSEGTFAATVLNGYGLNQIVTVGLPMYYRDALDTEFGTTATDYPTYYKNLVKKLIKNHSANSGRVFIGSTYPGSSQISLFRAYSLSAHESTELPRYCVGFNIDYDGRCIVWGTNDGEWYYKTLAYTSQIPTVTDYYWANVKVSSSSKTDTTPTFGSVTTSTIKSDNTILYLRYNNDNAKSVCLIDSAFIPTGGSNNKINLGKSSNRWKSLYTSKLEIDSTGKLMPIDTNSRSAGVYGVYDSTKVGHVWSMGSYYKISDDGLSTGNMYGLVYFHTKWSNNSAYNTATREDKLITEVSGYAGDHQIAMVSNGKVMASLGNYVWSRHGFKKLDSSDSYVLLGGGGHKTISSLSVASATTANSLKSTAIVTDEEFSLVNTKWTDVDGTYDNLAAGTYAVQITSGSNLVASGIMSYKNSSDTAGDEIPLHVHSTVNWRPYLRTYGNKLLISSNDTSAESRIVTIKIALIL